jgi:hypothetical protein
LFAFGFSFGCVYSCSHLPCTFDGWVFVLDFYIYGFSSILVVPLLSCGSPLWGSFACLDFGPCSLFLFLSCSWVLSFYKVWQGFIILVSFGGFFEDYIFAW